ncbi:hypothetical protein [Nocardioides sp. AE5]|uniref:hypothetical protein n=1 Tax=Nocardioides sp. AE5 TaxID=2962573 RepID=UPI002881B721|nr:hypothetical protein [Nocardioides sp. AE5]MDT0202229.1 hypothetical protein [Nocardioides sp. AE5]
MTIQHHLPPAERDALIGARRAATVAVVVLVTSAALIAASLALFLTVLKPEVAEHLFGQSERHTATVSEVDRASPCTRRHRHDYTLTWEEDGQQVSGHTDLCTRWEVGDEVEVWATSGEPQTQSPLAMWLSMGGALAGLALLGAFCLRAMVRQRRILTAALDGTWRPLAHHTVGHPGTPGFTIIDAAGQVRADRVGKGRSLYAARPDGTQSAAHPVRGTLLLDGVRRGKPRRLALWAGEDGSRTWRWHG